MSYFSFFSGAKPPDVILIPESETNLSLQPSSPPHRPNGRVLTDSAYTDTIHAKRSFSPIMEANSGRMLSTLQPFRFI